MPSPYVLLVVANVIYGTSYLATRLALDGVPPATLALARMLIGLAVLAPLTWRNGRAGVARSDAGRIALMGVVGFAAAFALGNWGLERSTVTNAALLIIVEPVSLLLLGPLLLGERLALRELAGAAVALGGTVLVVMEGLPGLTAAVAPHWRGDVLLVLSGLAYAGYSLLGRAVLARSSELTVTTWSIVAGAVAMSPFVANEWLDGRRALWTAPVVAGTVYLGLVITALGYLLWNHALARVAASRVGIFVTIQPVVGALLAAVVAGERPSGWTAAGAVLIVAGLLLTVRARARERYT